MSKTVTIELSDDLHQRLTEMAERQGRTLEDLLEFKIGQFGASFSLSKGTHSVKDIKPVGLGKILKPWNSRAELLEDFFEREDLHRC